MKFGKTYNVLLPSFPPEWQERAISYGQLKKLIKNVVDELSQLGLDPVVLHQLLHAEVSGESVSQYSGARVMSSLGVGESSAVLLNSRANDDFSPQIHERALSDFAPHATYELIKLPQHEDVIIPQLRVWINSPTNAHPETTLHFETLGSAASPIADPSLRPMGSSDASGELSTVMASSAKYRALPSILWALQSQNSPQGVNELSARSSAGPQFDDTERSSVEAHIEHDPALSTSVSASGNEVTISLASDVAFYQLLTTTLRSLTEYQATIKSQFFVMVEALSIDVSRTSRPSSKRRSDLYAWRRIFQLWIESQIFEGHIETDRGERGVEEAEARLTGFAREVTKHGLGDQRTLKGKDSRATLDRFLQLNVLLLDIKKFHVANAEAARKIMKKHEKRTALMVPSDHKARLLPMLAALSPGLSLDLNGASLSHILVTQLTEVLLPIIPSIDDYACLICTSIAFIPIRLNCNHLFCVRCLVKMQKRGQAECPLCRSPTVLVADRHNVDIALKRFMLEWFPLESKEKDKANQREAAEEELRAMGFQVTDSKCIIM